MATSAGASCWSRLTGGRACRVCELPGAVRAASEGEAGRQAAVHQGWLLLLLLRPLPSRQRHLPRACNREFAGRRIVADRRTCPDRGLRANCDRRDQRGIGTDEGAVFDAGDVLVRTVVIAGDGAGAED